MKSVLSTAVLAASLVNAKWDGKAPAAPTAIVTSYLKNMEEPAATNAPAAGNPFQGAKLYANKFYANEVKTLAIPKLANKALASGAQAVAKIPTFFWMWVFHIWLWKCRLIDKQGY